jgi:hypothetical protein
MATVIPKSQVFYKKILFFGDIFFLIYQSEENINQSDLMYSFSTDYYSVGGELVTVDLVKGGRHLPVNEQNKHKYVEFDLDSAFI